MAGVTFETSVFQREVDLVLNSGIKPVHYRWHMEIHANGMTISPTVVDSVERERNYIKNAFDILSVKCHISNGLMHNNIVSFKDKLEVTLKAVPVQEQNRREDKLAEREAYRFRATLYENKSSLLEAKDPTLLNQKNADRANIVPVEFQLVDPIVEQLRLMSVGGVFRNTSVTDCVRTVLGFYSKKIQNADGTYGVKGVDVAPHFNDQVRDHCVIPHLTRLMDFPGYVNRYVSGLYSGGFNYYMQDNMWYLFPPYDVTRYPETKRTLTIINVPRGRLPQVERSYRVTPSQVIILATDDVKHVDMSEQMQLNMGNGVRYSDANVLFEKFAKIEGNKAIITRADNNSEFVYKSRKDNVNNVKESDERITSNHPYQYGKIAERAGSYIQTVWEGSDDSELYPGMPVKFMYLENSRSQEIYGNLVGVHTYHIPVTEGLVDIKYMSKSALTVFINRDVVFEEKP